MRNQGFDTCTKNARERCSCALYSKNPQKSNRKDFAHFCGGKKPQPQKLVAGADHAAACRSRRGAVVRSRPRCRSSSTSAAFPSPPGSAGAGWSRCRHRQSRSLQSRAVSRGIRSRGQSPARRGRSRGRSGRCSAGMFRSSFMPRRYWMSSATFSSSFSPPRCILSAMTP